MRFDDYRRQLRAVQAPAGWEEAVRARIAAAPAPPVASAAPASAPAPAPPAASAAPRVRGAPRVFRPTRLCTPAVPSACASPRRRWRPRLRLPSAGRAPSRDWRGRIPPPRWWRRRGEALDLATPALRLDPDAGLSFQLADGCARVRLRAEFRCRNAGEGAYEVAVHGDGLALQSRGAAFDDSTSSTLVFEPGRPAGGYVVVEVPLNRDAWRQRLIGRGFDDEAALEVLREALRLLGEGRVVPSRPGAPDAVYAPDLPAALRGSADEPPLSDALDAGSRRLVVSLRRLS